MAAAEDQERMKVITDLSNRALLEYDGLQRKHEATAMQCKRLEGERDQAIERLNEFQKVSEMVLEEVNIIQETLGIERTCRESAEALASKLTRQNRSLKRKSMMLLSHLSPETLSHIDLEEEEAEDVCVSLQCQNKLSELQNTLQSTLKEKTRAVDDSEAVREELREAREDLLMAKQETAGLTAETLRLKKLLGRYNRVSQLAVEEYAALQDAVNLEQGLRTEAENVARAMMVEQKVLKRQNEMVMQTSSAGHALQEALEQVTALTRQLEAQQLQHQTQMKQLQDQFGGGCAADTELRVLRCQLELVEEEKNDDRNKLAKAREEIKDLKFTVEELQNKLQKTTNKPPAPPPPPPPPAPTPPANPLSSLLSLIRRRTGASGDIPLTDRETTPDVDVRQRAVEEMMQRIKHGVQLRPVGQSASGRRRRQVEKLPANSAMEELKGIMMKSSSSSRRVKAPLASLSATGDDELRRILLRRRDVVEPQP